MNQVYLLPGTAVEYEQQVYHIRSILDHRRLLVARQSDDELKVALVTAVTPLPDAESIHKDLAFIPDEDWAVANERYQIIRPILENRGDGALVKRIAKEQSIGITTLYRWLDRYDATGLVSSLINNDRDGGKGKSRLTPEVDAILNDAIQQEYLTRQRKPPSKVYQVVATHCRNAGLPTPHPNTVRNRIAQLAEYTRLKFRHGKGVAEQQLAPLRGHFPGADYPLAMVQMDHTELDIELVDESSRRVIGRPWITLAIDVHSRMVLGFYISFDPPGSMGTGLCLANAMLPKEKWLAKYNVAGDWPCWGVMRGLHVDNAKEFRGNMLKRACQEYGIELNWRPVKTPNYGGHIERLLGTVLAELHSVRGSTFSNPQERGDYDSSGQACLTLAELEHWLLNFIVNIYHVRLHSAIGTTPLARYTEGLLGGAGSSGIGLPSRFMQEDRLRLDFMPFEERTIQDYGVQIDHICYYHDVLRRWINATDGSKYKVKRKFIFKRDPRDVSLVYFFDPELSQYFAIPYRDTSRPPMSIWEFREALKRAKELQPEVDEERIFQAYEELRRIEALALTETRKVRRRNARQAIHPTLSLNQPTPIRSTLPTLEEVPPPVLKPFERW